jgi:hypothetical protein
MLVLDPSQRTPLDQLLAHEWVRVDGVASDQVIEPEVLQRMRRFAAMNRLKKEALKVGWVWVMCGQGAGEKGGGSCTAAALGMVTCMCTERQPTCSAKYQYVNTACSPNPIGNCTAHVVLGTAASTSLHSGAGELLQQQAAAMMLGCWASADAGCCCVAGHRGQPPAR